MFPKYAPAIIFLFTCISVPQALAQDQDSQIMSPEQDIIRKITEALSELDAAQTDSPNSTNDSHENKFISTIRDALSAYESRVADTIENSKRGLREIKHARQTATALRDKIGLKERSVSARLVAKANRAWKSAYSETDLYKSKIHFDHAATYYKEAIDKAKKIPRRVGPVPKFSR